MVTASFKTRDSGVLISNSPHSWDSYPGMHRILKNEAKAKSSVRELIKIQIIVKCR